MDWLPTLLSTIAGVIIGSFITYHFNIRFFQKQEKEARHTRLHRLKEEISANLLLVEAKNLTGHGGRPRLLASAVQDSQMDWFSLETKLQESLAKLYSEISIWNDQVDLFVRITAGGQSPKSAFFDEKYKDIRILLNSCGESLQWISPSSKSTMLPGGKHPVEG